MRIDATLRIISHPTKRCVLTAVLPFMASVCIAAPEPKKVTTTAGLKAVLSALEVDVVILIGPGDYGPGHHVRNICGDRIIFRRSQAKTNVNIGTGTETGTFIFRDERWFAEEAPEKSKPALPSPEQGGIYGTDPWKPLNRPHSADTVESP